LGRKLPPGRLPDGTGISGIPPLDRFAVVRDAEEIPLRAFGGRQLPWSLALRQGRPTSNDVIAGLLAARGQGGPCRPAAADALRAAGSGGYLILVPRLRELAWS